MVDSSCVVIGLFSQVHLLSFPSLSAILCHSFSVIFSYQCARCLSSLYYSLNLPFIGGPRLIKWMIQCLSRPLCKAFFVLTRAVRLLVVGWQFNSLPPPSPVAILLSSPHRPTQNGGNSAKQTEKRATKKSTKKSTKNSENETKNLQNSSPMCFPFWFLFGCGHWIVFSHFACLFPLLSCSLNSKKKKKYCKYIRKIRHPNITLYLSLNDLSKPWLSTELAYLKVWLKYAILS